MRVRHHGNVARLEVEGFLPEVRQEQVVCGMSLGVADPDAIENTLVTEREPVGNFTRFLD